MPNLVLNSEKTHGAKFRIRTVWPVTGASWYTYKMDTQGGNEGTARKTKDDNETTPIW